MIALVQIIQTLEDKMALKPRVRVKAQGRAVAIGTYEEIVEGNKVKIKPKRKHGQTLNQQYASANRKKWRPAK